ncbi:MAG: hypothetical protein OXH15_13890 [Gammaproteobacteria bacterium]|nr:hypothetical protein [Gammaproteobacteria bacterium]
MADLGQRLQREAIERLLMRAKGHTLTTREICTRLLDDYDRASEDPRHESIRYLLNAMAEDKSVIKGIAGGS